MKEVLRTNDLIELSWAENLLEQYGIECYSLDWHTSALHGSILAIEKRLMVIEDNYKEAKRLIKQAQLERDAPCPDS